MAVFLISERKTMEETRFEKLKKLRQDIEQEKRRIARTKAAFEERLAKQKEEFNQKLKKLQEGLRVKEQRLREEENLTVIGDVEATNISPEALAKPCRAYDRSSTAGPA